jgi:DNA-binding SARP family transcriptional activator/DNA-binding XRE family transcriptional regulator
VPVRPGRNGDDQLGRLVKRYRTARMLTQRQLAVAAGIPLGTLRDLEQGRHAGARWQTVESVAAALEVDWRQRAALVQACQAGRPAAPGRPAWPGSGDRWEPASIELLGPLTARLDGAALPLGPARQRAVLGLLALHGAAGVHRDAIIDVLWGARPPASALSQLHGYVSRLRNLLAPRPGGHPGPIATAGPRYRLQAGRSRLDLATFGQLARRADVVAAHGHLETACRLYEQALALWRGDVLSDVDLLHGHPAVTELIQRRWDTVFRYADVAVRTAVPHRALPWLRELCAHDDLNEAAHARLMIALTAAGQRAAALGVFHDVRRRLIDELGVDPGPQLTMTQARILGPPGQPWRLARPG